MDKRRGVLNIGASIVSRVLLLLAALYVRRLLIMYIGNEANGLNSLYASIIGMLSVAELGVGSAIVFSMYKPIVDGDNRTVRALYGLYRKLYRIIGAVILVAGIAVMPFLPRLISDYEKLPFDVYVPYILTLTSVCISYIYSAKTSLIQAYKDNYITTGITTVCGLIRSALQIVALILFKSFVAFLICRIIETVLVWAMTDRAVRKLHPEIIGLDISAEILGEDTKQEVSKNVKAMFMHKMGTVLVGAVDSLIISTFIGVAILGKYSNYTAVSTAMVGVIALFFIPLTSVIGHMCASESKEVIKGYFGFLYNVNYVLGLVFFLGYYAVIDSLIAFLFGPNLDLSRKAVYVITLNSFIGYMRYALLLFRDAAGAFYYDRWKPFFEGITNLILSIALVKMLPDDMSVVGVVLATVITGLFICHVVEPYIIYKHVFKESVKGFYMKNYSFILVFSVCLIIMENVKVNCSSAIASVLLNGLISLGISAAVLLIICLLDKSMWESLHSMANQLLRLVKQHNKIADKS